MPTKPKKVQGAGVGVFADGGILSRLQSVTADTDLGVEEIREISNAQIVEFVEGTPTVSIQLEANQHGRRENVAYLTGQDGENISEMITPGAGNFTSPMTREITHFSFDGTQTDLVIQVEEDSVLARSIYMPDCFMTSVSWNFDVGGVATESYSLESDDKRMYVGTKKELMVCSGYYDASDAKTLTSGYIMTTHPQLNKADGNGYFIASGFSDVAGSTMSWTPIEISLDGSVLKDPATGLVLPLYPGGSDDSDFLNFDEDKASQIIAGRVRCLAYKDNIVGTMIADSTYSSTPNIGGIRKGMVEIFLVSGSMWNVDTRLDGATENEEFLRLQTCSVDIDLAREALEELGNPEAYERSLNFPISATVNFSALASDVQAWAGFANLREEYDNSWGGSVQTIGFRDFGQTAGLLVKIYDDDETNAARNRLMTLTVSGIRVASESFSVDAGGNAVQEFSCSADNFVIS